MNDFFNGWHRKAGMVVLLVACLLMGAWIRSLVLTSQISWPIGDNLDYSITFQRDGIEFGKHQRFGIIFGNLIYTIEYERLIIPYWTVLTPLIPLSASLLIGSPLKTVRGLSKG